MAVPFDKDKDYTAEIQKAVANKDYAQAAQLEQQLNAKIDYLNETGTNKWNAQKQNSYTQYLDTGSKTTGGQYVGTGSGDGVWRDYVDMDEGDRAGLDYWGKAWNSAQTQAEKEYAHAQADAIREKYGYLGGDDGSEFIPILQQQTGSFSYDAPPTYRDPYSDRIDQLLDQILNREGFTYDVSKDPLFAQYADQYTREGQRAMKDTMGQMSARTGGLASSYAQTAAQQSNQYYMQQLADKVPELWQLAYEMYLDNIDLQVQDMGLLQDMSDTQYNRYRDTMNDWRNDRDFAYGVYRDDQAEDWAQREWDYQLDRDAVEDARRDSQDSWKPELTAAQVLKALESGVVNDSTMAAYEYYFGESWGEDEEAEVGTEETGGPSFYYDEDEGIFTFNGTAYNNIADLQAAIESTPMTDAEFDALLRKLALFGIPVTETK